MTQVRYAPSSIPNSASGAQSLFHAAVIGAGISGLTAALHLQTQGLRTVVLERRAVPGGLCGTFTLDGYEFDTGCNDFGRGIVKILEDLDVHVDFNSPKARFQLGEHVINLPPDRLTALKLVRRLPGLVSAVWHARRNLSQSIGQFIDEHLSDALLADLACLPAAAMLRSPDDISLGEIKETFSRNLDYGYEKSCTPVGGPRAMIDAMVQRFESLGGEIRLGCESLAVDREGDNKRILTSAGPVRARTVVSSQGRWDHFPSGTKPGLEAAALLLAVDKSFQYPQGYHTLAWFPVGVAQQLRRLEAGLPLPSDPQTSFHVFRSDLPEQPGHYTLNAFVPMPRGVRDPTVAQRTALSEHILQTLDAKLPGFKRALLYQRFLSPAEYQNLLGLRCAPSPYVPPRGFNKLPSHHAAQDVYFVGTSVNPPGEHAGAAARSGKLAAQQVIQRLQMPPISAR